MSYWKAERKNLAKRAMERDKRKVQMAYQYATQQYQLVQKDWTRFTEAKKASYLPLEVPPQPSLPHPPLPPLSPASTPSGAHQPADARRRAAQGGRHPPDRRLPRGAHPPCGAAAARCGPR